MMSQSNLIPEAFIRGRAEAGATRAMERTFFSLLFAGFFVLCGTFAAELVHPTLGSAPAVAQAAHPLPNHG